jgi:hypothetical protein
MLLPACRLFWLLCNLFLQTPGGNPLVTLAAVAAAGAAMERYAGFGVAPHNCSMPQRSSSISSSSGAALQPAAAAAAVVTGGAAAAGMSKGHEHQPLPDQPQQQSEQQQSQHGKQPPAAATAAAAAAAEDEDMLGIIDAHINKVNKAANAAAAKVRSHVLGCICVCFLWF